MVQVNLHTSCKRTEKVLIFITPQFNRNISTVKQFYRLKIVSRYLKDLYKEHKKVPSAKRSSVILYDFLKIIPHARVCTNYQ